MTTSVEDGVRGHFAGAFAANPAGLLALATALLLLVARPAQLRIPLVLPAIALPAMWLFELHRFSIL
jgi:hypothetical protein